MISVPVALLMLVLHFAYADHRDAVRAAREVCPGTQVTRVGDHFQFGCREGAYEVACADGACDVRPR